MKNLFKYMVLTHKSVKIYDNRMQLRWTYIRELKWIFTAFFVINIFHEKVFISQFVLFSA